ncbi:uncharacterized protein PADG_07047 [Paracoccidioides brasiliensis Pb18]|uniref:BHLH domain-containing protein n=1 Tax=Paracoccidioides brasiliensis (strain Pb18) TaxID=502780 RepID=C1GIG1_PARBD|nr:uncharacterized protein PADG_07047 [Paracoccidioides brasiliensis Pb18]EEH42227.1 hypothetical protein PADG_07047 [Paracoccidioides brasiliensis Pb18]
MKMSASEPIHQQRQHLGRPSQSTSGPFGYPLFNIDTPYDEAPALPPGPSLLDDTESNMLNNFFTSMDANHLDGNDFLFSLGDQNKPGANFGFEWAEELPPNFEGSTTSLGPYPAFANGIHEEGIHMSKISPHSSDVIAAASMLYQKNNVINSHDYVPGQVFMGNDHDIHGNSGLKAKNSFLAPRFVDPLPQGPSPKDLSLFKGFHTAKMYFDVEQQLHPEVQQRISTLRWGSDAGFSQRRYHAPPNQPSEEDRTKDLLQSLDCLEAQSSAANTRHPSPSRRSLDHGVVAAPEWTPLVNGNGNTNGVKALLPANDLRQEAEEGQDDDSARPKKRRKSKNRIKDEEDVEADLPNNTNNDIRESNNSTNGSQSSRPRRFSSSTDTSLHHHHRKPKAQGKPRENLTEEQKRTNHILSEQKRRNLIKQGFDDLCSLVPELHGGGFSKSTMLIQAAEWLEDLLRGNEILRIQLDELKKRSTMDTA